MKGYESKKEDHLDHCSAIDLFLKNKSVFLNAITGLSIKDMPIQMGTGSSRKVTNLQTIVETLSSKKINLEAYPDFQSVAKNVREIQPEGTENVYDVAQEKAFQAVNKHIKNPQTDTHLIVDDSAMYMVLDSFKDHQEFLEKKSKIGSQISTFIKYEIKNAMDAGMHLGDYYLGKAMSIAKENNIDTLKEREFYLKDQSAISSTACYNNQVQSMGTGSGEMNLRFEIKNFGTYKTSKNLPNLGMNFSFIEKSVVQKIEELLSESNNKYDSLFKERDESKQWIYFNDVYLKLRAVNQEKLLHLLTPQLPALISYLEDFHFRQQPIATEHFAIENNKIVKTGGYESFQNLLKTHEDFKNKY